MCVMCIREPIMDQGINGFRFFQRPTPTKKTGKTPLIGKKWNPLQLQISSKSSCVCYHAFDEEIKPYANNNAEYYGFFS